MVKPYCSNGGWLYLFPIVSDDNLYPFNGNWFDNILWSTVRFLFKQYTSTTAFRKSLYDRRNLRLRGDSIWSYLVAHLTWSLILLQSFPFEFELRIKKLLGKLQSPITLQGCFIRYKTPNTKRICLFLLWYWNRSLRISTYCY